MATLVERFWSKVDKQAGGCWLWTASTFKTGRGQFRVGARNQQAHRVAWELTFGSPPAGLLRSTCGNLRCVRPDHQIVADHRAGPINLARTPARRFEAKVHKGPDCWQWGGATVRGYGQFRATGSEGAPVPAHRFAWELAFGPIPDGADVLHRCGNRACVRPDHLVLWDPAAARQLPTPRQLDILRAWLRTDMRYGSHQRVAAALGLRPGSVHSELYATRRRMGVASTRAAVAWLDEHDPGWRDGRRLPDEAAPGRALSFPDWEATPAAAAPGSDSGRPVPGNQRSARSSAFIGSGGAGRGRPDAGQTTTPGGASEGRAPPGSPASPGE